MRSQGILLGVLVAVLGTGCTIIEEGEVGVSISFGRIADEPVAPGVAYVIPVARFVERWNIKLQERKEQALVPSSEGLIVGLDISLLYQLTDAAQGRMIGDVLLEFSRGLCDGQRCVSALLDEIDHRIDANGLESICERSFGDRARARRFEIAAALNRLRSLRLC